ncbi:MAG TPA: hypothetical protein ENN88_03500 [Candidatus Coatesbacteria bacterium]|nr:hypothetical protein [Candidatus Coatesbacteria bacterium]
MKAGLLTALLVVLCVSTPAAETYEIDGWAVGTVGFGWTGFGAALAGPGEYLINPAGLGNAEQTEIIGTYVPEYEDRLTPCFGASFIKPMRTESASLGEERTSGTLAVSLFNVAQEQEHDGRLEGNSLAVISFGSRASELVSYGVNLKVLSVENDGRADSGFGLDLGVQLYPGDFRFGLAVSNVIPPGISLAAERTFAERTVRLGAGYSLYGIFNIAAELEYATSAARLDYGLYAELIPLKLEVLRLALGGGWRIEENIWGGFVSLRLGFFEAAGAAQLDEGGFTVFSFKLAFSPDF